MRSMFCRRSKAWRRKSTLPGWYKPRVAAGGTANSIYGTVVRTKTAARKMLKTSKIDKSKLPLVRHKHEFSTNVPAPPKKAPRAPSSSLSSPPSPRGPPQAAPSPAASSARPPFLPRSRHPPPPRRRRRRQGKQPVRLRRRSRQQFLQLLPRCLSRWRLEGTSRGGRGKTGEEPRARRGRSYLGAAPTPVPAERRTQTTSVLAP